MQSCLLSFCFLACCLVSKISRLCLLVCVTSDQRLFSGLRLFVLFVCVGASRPNQHFCHVGLISYFIITKQRIKCLAQGHNNVTLATLELATFRSPV